MSSRAGAFRFGKRARSAATISAVSSTESVVCVTKATRVRVAHLEARDVRDVLHQEHLAARGAIEAPHRALDFRVPGVADQQHVARPRAA